MIALALILLAPQAFRSAEGLDLRTAYDVRRYGIELAIHPERREIEGRVAVRARALRPELRTCILDLAPELEVAAVDDGVERSLAFGHEGASLQVQLAEPLAEGDEFTVRVHYRGRPRDGDFDGFHWNRTADGKPWIDVACQGIGAHAWWPCKASFFHPEDRPEGVSVDLVVPAGLVGVSNGRLVSSDAELPEGFESVGGPCRRWRWRHDYPVDTYAVSVSVGPYEELREDLTLPGLEAPVPWSSFVLPESVEKARLQFAEVPGILEVYSEAFGPWPFPASKVGLVEASFWGMEHSTLVAYGSSYPRWLREVGRPDPYAERNRGFDYILVHELAHEWWGNAVAAADWGDFWLLEGFATYAEGVYVERTRGRAEADRYFARMARQVPGETGRLYRGKGVDSGTAYTGLLYTKGACVLNTLRYYVNDDPTWWRVLRAFFAEHRYGTATTQDFQELLERTTERSWEEFFRDWVYGEGTPEVTVELDSDAEGIHLRVVQGRGAFTVPIDLAWSEGERRRQLRRWFGPGSGSFDLVCRRPPEDLRVVGLERLLGSVKVLR